MNGTILETKLVKGRFMSNTLNQRCPTGGPKAGCGPPAYIYAALEVIELKLFVTHIHELE